MRFFLKIEYKGTNYCGWQIQDNANSVQAELHAALTTLLKTETEVSGAGRTDAGVHALGMIAHFDAEFIAIPADFRYRLNAILPRDIAVHSVRRVKDHIHARFDALSRTYEYRIHTYKNVFSNQNSYFFSPSLNVEYINETIKIFKNWIDFKAFTKVQTEIDHFNCNIFESYWERSETGHVFYIRANRFLRGMVRTMVGTLLDVGIQKISPKKVLKILKSRDRRRASRSVPADGLYFVEAKYLDEIWIED